MNNVRRVIFRVDANRRMGTGHLRRCIVLAREFRQKKYVYVLFISKKDSFISKTLKKNNLKYKLIPQNINQYNEVSWLLKNGLLRKGDILIFDGYHFSDKYLNSINSHPGIYTVLVDDYFHRRDYPANAIINYNIYARKYKYPSRNGQAMLLGPKYTIIDPQILKAKRKVCPRVLRITITLGGSDYRNTTFKIVKILKKIDCSFKAKVVLGPLFKHVKKIKENIGTDKRFTILQNLPHLGNVVASTDLAICSASVTAYEFLSKNVPTILWFVEENQKLIAREISRLGAGINMGFPSSKSVRMFNNCIRRIMQNHKKIEDMRKRTRNIADGKGAQRITSQILFHAARTR